MVCLKYAIWTKLSSRIQNKWLLSKGKLHNYAANILDRTYYIYFRFENVKPCYDVTDLVESESYIA